MMNSAFIISIHHFLHTRRWIRTTISVINSHVLYRLSYTGFVVLLFGCQS